MELNPFKVPKNLTPDQMEERAQAIFDEYCPNVKCGDTLYRLVVLGLLHQGAFASKGDEVIEKITNLDNAIGEYLRVSGVHSSKSKTATAEGVLKKLVDVRNAFVEKMTRWKTVVIACLVVAFVASVGVALRANDR